jgi:hypothetical protein
MVRALLALAGCALLVATLADAFQTVVAARRAQRIFRPTRLFYTVSWAAFAYFCKKVESGKRRERILSIYGPLSLLALLAIWAASIIFAFTLLHWAAGLRVAEENGGFGFDLFFSACALFTMMVASPLNAVSRGLVVV